MNAHTHAVPAGQQARPGQCAWAFHFEDVQLRCDDPAIPGGDLCATHDQQRRLHP